MKHFYKTLALSFAIAICSCCSSRGQETVDDSDHEIASSQSDDTSAIEAAIQSYADAFNSRDAKALAKHWSEDGVYTSRITGNQVVGRDKIEKEFSSVFDLVSDVRLELATESIEFVSPSVAIERGEATVNRPETSPAKSRYSVVYVKSEGTWLIDRVNEEQASEPVSTHYEHLKELQWIIGDWVDQDGSEITVKTSSSWTRNKNFILRAFSASSSDEIDITGIQVIGWDPSRNQIRSWVFDSDGGVAEGIWKPKGKNWIVNATATLPDGEKASSTTIFRPLNEDSFGWQQTSRVVGGEILPNIDEVIIAREVSE